MKKLYIVRHAKSDHTDPKQKDFDRVLNERGEKDAPFMGANLAKQYVFPDLIITSPAFRAKQTAKLIAKELGSMDKIILEPSLYEASWSDLLKVLKSQKNTHSTLMIVGHNPSLSYLGHHLVNFNENLPTCGILEIDIDSENWADIDIADAVLHRFDYPKKEL